MSPSRAAISRYHEHELAGRARDVMPSGNTRTTLFVPPTPPYARSGLGAMIEDELGHRVIDCNNNYTALVHGHGFGPIQEAVAKVLTTGTAFGLPTAAEVDLAEHLHSRTGLNRWRFSNSGTEAVMTAVRGARAFTGRDKIVRFAGSYHGTSDAVVDVAAPGIPAAVASESIVVPQGDMAAFDAAMKQFGSRVAAVIIDLLPNRAGLVPADRDFVDHVRKSTRRTGSLLIVDEVITFRLAVGGLHSEYAAEPDLVTLGKIIGGGFPVGAVGGTEEVMAVFDPQRSAHVGWGGTFSANPVSMTAGLVALEYLDASAVDRLNELGNMLRQLLRAEGVAVSGFGSLLQIREDLDLKRLWWELYLEGVLAGTNGLLALSTPMTDDDVRRIATTVTTVIHAARAEDR
jgi:glutamate-1-semialdehyde 2,1-aminomutase